MSRLVVPPVVEPVTVAEARAHLQYGLDLQDTVIEEAIRAGRDLVERYCQRPYMTQERELEWVPGGTPAGTVVTFGVVTTEAAMAGAPLGTEVTDSHVDYFPRNLLVWRERARSLAPVAFPASPGIDLGWAAPLDRIVEVRGADGTVLPETAYSVDQTVEPARLYVDAGSGVAVRYVVGWPAADQVPPAMRHAVLALVGLFFYYRANPPQTALEPILASVESYRLAALA